MKAVFGSRKTQAMMRFGVFLFLAALIAGMAGCTYNPPSQNLEIRTWYDLDAVRNNLTGNYILMNDLGSSTAGYEELASPTANGGKGWEPIGFLGGTASFTGTFDGQGHEVRDLFVNCPDQLRVGLFGMIDVGAVVKNIGVVNVAVTGDRPVGGLAGYNWGSISNSYFTGNVTGNQEVGGLVGCNALGTLDNCHSIAIVIGEENVGGLVGYSDGTVSNSYSSGHVTGHSSVGGLIGLNEQLAVPAAYSDGSVEFATVNDSYSAANVAGDEYVGGLVGWNSGYVLVGNSYSSGHVTGHSSVGGLVGGNAGTVDNSYSTGSVTGCENLGGLVGWNRLTVSNSHFTGSVTGNSSVGGLVGYNYYGTVSNSYSSGAVTGNLSVGGLVGANVGDVTESFWDLQTSGQATSDGGTGKNTTEMQDIATFSGAGWNIIAVALHETNPTYIWNIVDSVTYPFLSWQPV